MPGFDTEFPGNSHKGKEPEPAEPKVVQRVTEGTVIRRKTSLGKRFTDLFIAGDSDSVMKYVLLEVMLPGARDMVADGITQYVERMIFGESRSTSRRTGLRSASSTSPGYVSYNRFATGKPSHEAPRAGISAAKARTTQSFDQIVLTTRNDAEQAIDGLFDIISKYEQATVADLYELVGETGDFTAQKWGWTDIRGADVQRIRDGYLLRLPPPVSLE